MQRGFTIVEMTAAVALLMLLVGLGYVFSFTYFQTQQLRAAADITVSELRQAQTDSFTQTNDAGHGVKIFPDHVIRFQGSTYATRNISKDIRTDFPTAFTVSGVDEMTFTVNTVNPTASGTITLAHDTLAIDILVSAYGLVTQTERTIGG